MSRQATGRTQRRTPQSETNRPEEEGLSAPIVQAERRSLQERLSEWLDFPLAILALIWTALLVVELAFTPPPSVSERILQVDFAIWVIFALVFLLELGLAPDKLRYLQTNFLAAISVVLPFIRVVRVLRLAGALRSVSLVRIVTVGNRATSGAAEIFSQHRFQYVLSLVAISTLLAAAGVYFFERDVAGTQFQDFWDALWWAAALATTINTNIEPLTAEGRVIGLLLRVVGLAVFGYVTASIASFLVDERVARRTEKVERTEQTAERETIRTLTREIRQLRQELEQMQPPPRRRNNRHDAGRAGEP